MVIHSKIKNLFSELLIQQNNCILYNKDLSLFWLQESMSLFLTILVRYGSLHGSGEKITVLLGSWISIIQFSTFLSTSILSCLQSFHNYQCSAFTPYCIKTQKTTTTKQYNNSVSNAFIEFWHCLFLIENYASRNRSW